MTGLELLAPDVGPRAAWLVSVARYYGLRPVIHSTLRTAAEQAALHARRFTNPFPVARPGSSLHERGRAFDLTTTPRAALPWLGQVWESIGGRWGGRFGDPVHFAAPG